MRAAIVTTPSNHDFLIAPLLLAVACLAHRIRKPRATDSPPPRLRRDLNSKQLASLRMTRQRLEEAFACSTGLANNRSTAYWQHESIALRKDLARLTATARLLCQMEEEACLRRRHLPNKAIPSISREDLIRGVRQATLRCPAHQLRRHSSGTAASS